MAAPIKKPEEIREILARACARRELLILATPYLRFESSFVALEGGDLHVLATMSRDDAAFGLRGPDTVLRFPEGLGFFEAPVQVLGLGQHEGRRTVRLALPKAVRENDQRVAYRVERVGRVEVTFSTPKANLFTATLLDISTSGARIHAHRDLPPGELTPGDRIVATIPLLADLRIESAARVRHTRGRTVGLQYQPELPEAILEPLSRWVFLRREEERERLARRLELATRDLQRPPSLPPASILLVSPDALLEAELQPVLASLHPLVRLAPSMQALKEALLAKPVLVVIHLGGSGLDERHRLRALAETAQRRAPLLLLGTGVDGATLFELASEWKAASAIAWAPSRAAFLQRLAQGILRRHLALDGAPLAPPEG